MGSLGKGASRGGIWSRKWNSGATFFPHQNSSPGASAVPHHHGGPLFQSIGSHLSEMGHPELCTALHVGLPRLGNPSPNHSKQGICGCPLPRNVVDNPPILFLVSQL